MVKHTPGPWRKVKCKCGFEGCNQYFVEPIRGTDGRLYEADADLIVAAPELLEALRAMVAASDKVSEVVRQGQSAGKTDNEINNDLAGALIDQVLALENARKAIAKAEGRG